MKPNFPSILQVIGLLAIYIAATLVAFVAIGAVRLFSMPGFDPNDLSTINQEALASDPFVIVGTTVLGMAATAFAAYKLGRFQGIPWGTTQLPVATWLLAIPLILASSFCFAVLVELLPGAEAFAEMMEQTLGLTPWIGLAVVITAPLLEELLFRGMIMRGLLRQYSPGYAIGISAFVFGLFHLYPHHIIYAGAMGVVLGYVYYRTNSLWLVIFMHFINNGFSWAAGLVAPDFAGQSTPEVYGIAGALGISLVLGLVAVGCWYLFDRLTTPTPDWEALLTEDEVVEADGTAV